MDGQRLLRTVGLVLLVIGIILPLLNVDLAVIIYDNTSPVITNPIFADGTTFSYIQNLLCTASDPESGVETVTIRLQRPDTTIAYENTFTTPYSGDRYSGNWGVTLTNKITSPSGQWTLYFIAKNGVGLTSTKVCVGTLYSGLQGDWYINGVKVTSTTQEFKITQLPITFKFVKTAGVEDSKITCTATWTVVKGSGTSGSLQLTYKSAGTWEGSISSWTAGKYNVELKASDGYGSPVVMQILNFNFPELPDSASAFNFSRFINLLTISGLALLLLSIFVGRKHV